MNKEFQEKGYIVIRNFIPKDLCKFAQVYYKIRQDTLQYDIDVQCPESKSFYADPFCETLLLTACKKISEATGLELLPTYSYTRVYAKGDELVIHTDRAECQYSATLSLGRPSAEEISPIYMSENADGSDASELLLDEGDICIYMGNRMSHWRKPFEQSWYLQTFLHYVDKNGQYGNRLYDGRRSLGIKK
jgi:hypothetical protein